MSLERIVSRALGVNPTPELQRLAIALANSNSSESASLSTQLARCAALVHDVRVHLEQSQHPTVRQIVWARKDSDPVRVLAALPTERSIAVIKEMIVAVKDTDALAAALGESPSLGRAKAIARSARWDLPADLLEAALAVAGRDYDHLPIHLAQATTDLTAVAVSTRVDAIIRLAALAAGGTPDAVVAEHLGPLILACAELPTGTDMRQVSAILSRLAKRSPSPEVLDAFTQHRQYLYWDQDAKVAQQFAHWVSHCRDLMDVADVPSHLAAAQSPADVLDVWNQLPSEHQRTHAQQFIDHRLCPLDVFDAAVGHIDLWSNIHSRGPGQVSVWMAQREELFKAVAREEILLSINVALLNGILEDWTVGREQLANWVLDVLVEHPHQALRNDLWRSLLSLRDFPRHRVSELPTAAIEAATDSNPSLDWVAHAVAAELSSIPVGISGAEAATVLRGLNTSDAAFLETVQVAKASLTRA